METGPARSNGFHRPDYCGGAGGVAPGPAGEAEGGHGVPLGDVPALPEFCGFVPGFAVVGDEPGLEVAGSVDPAAGAVVLVVPESLAVGGGAGAGGHGLPPGVAEGLVLR